MFNPATLVPLEPPAPADTGDVRDDRGHLLLTLRLGEPVRIGDVIV